ncbi:hypothetical protein M404DRAFT_1005187 [Pisolithus tinctorius Marx 270]|uniref:Uncharacterized protein n=1 Tax=Pisolithus tinctorius Marx 270 TaxID=870435 RepID=A0A0C3INI0_PISTI|nr:hypothetical protein M404DRAFT_1005187 [Pisolithus tinctorius Marx 270]
MMAISPHSGRLTLIMGSADTGTLCTVGSAASAGSYKHVTLLGTATIVPVPASGSSQSERARVEIVLEPSTSCPVNQNVFWSDF